MQKLILASLLMFFPLLASAQTTCPLGLVNDPAPGSCSTYIDTNRNALCDLSEVPLTNAFETVQNNTKVHSATVSEEELKQKTVAEVAELYGISNGDYRSKLSEFLNIDVKASDNLGILHDNNGLCAGVAAAIALDIKNNQAVAVNDYHDIVTGQELKQMSVAEVAQLYGVDESQYAALLGKYLGSGVKSEDSFQTLHDNLALEPTVAKDIAVGLQTETAASLSYAEPAQTIVPRYRFASILGVLIILYLISYILVKEKKYTLLIHRRIWNVLLLAFFLISALSGLLLVLRINYGWGIAWPFNILKLHVETGVAMAIVSFIHIFWHWQYYVLIFKKKKE